MGLPYGVYMQTLILVTGASGFVGQQVVAQLLARGVAVRLVVRQPLSAPWANHAGIESIRTTADVFAESPHWYDDVCRGVSGVLHLAWYTTHGRYLDSPKNRDCLQGTLALAQGAIRQGVQRFVGVGTCLEYAASNQALGIDSPLQPQSAYAAAKVAAFQALANTLPIAGVAFAWCRLFYLYGEGEHPDRLVPLLHRHLQHNRPVALSDGTLVRDYLEVTQAAQYLVDITLSDFEGAANLCSGIGVSIKALALAIAKGYGKKDLLQFGARPNKPGEVPHIVGQPHPYCHHAVSSRIFLNLP